MTDPAQEKMRTPTPYGEALTKAMKEDGADELSFSLGYQAGISGQAASQQPVGEDAKVLATRLLKLSLRVAGGENPSWELLNDYALISKDMLAALTQNTLQSQRVEDGFYQWILDLPPTTGALLSIKERAKKLLTQKVEAGYDSRPDGSGLDDGPELPLSVAMAGKRPLIVKAWQEGLSARACARVFDVSHDMAASVVRGLERHRQNKGPQHAQEIELLRNRVRALRTALETIAEVGNDSYLSAKVIAKVTLAALPPVTGEA